MLMSFLLQQDQYLLWGQVQMFVVHYCLRPSSAMQPEGCAEIVVNLMAETRSVILYCRPSFLMFGPTQPKHLASPSLDNSVVCWSHPLPLLAQPTQNNLD